MCFKKIVLIVTIIALLSFFGCNSSSQQKLPNTGEFLVNSIKKELPNAQNIRVLVTDELNNNGVAVISYDIVDMHIISYRFFQNIKMGVKLSVGGSSVVTPTPESKFSYSQGTGVDDNSEYYIVTYGEIYDKKIKDVRLIFNDGYKVIKPVINGGYLFIRKGKGSLPTIKSIEYLDDNLKTIDAMP